MKLEFAVNTPTFRVSKPVHTLTLPSVVAAGFGVQYQDMMAGLWEFTVVEEFCDPDGKGKRWVRFVSAKREGVAMGGVNQRGQRVADDPAAMFLNL